MGGTEAMHYEEVDCTIEINGHSKFPRGHDGDGSRVHVVGI